jgi:anaerobic ribonucleoside-triphosphate reductase activating protein
VRAETIAISRVHFPVHTLGPGKRLGIWLQGCSIRCPGCISMDTWAQGREQIAINALVEAASPWLDQAEGITVSGGEPFDQAPALETLLRLLRSRSNADILVYSGYSLVSLDLSKFSGLIDALICDPFLVDRDQTLVLRGSDNQRLIILSALGQRRFASYERSILEGERTLDVMFDGPAGEVFLAGIPSRGDLKRLSDLLTDQGHIINTTEDVRTFK